MRFKLGDRGTRGDLDALQTRIARLRADITAMEEAASREARTDAYRAAQDLRRQMANADLPQKRAELEALLRQEAALQARVRPAAPPRPERLTGRASAPRRGAGPGRGRLRLALVGSAVVAALLIGLALIASRMGVSPPALEAPPAPVELAPRLDQPAGQPGQTFFRREVTVDYNDGRLMLSGSPAPVGSFGVDDGMTITVTRPDGSVASWSRSFNQTCDANVATEPEEVTHLFAPGPNVVSVALYDTCGGTSGTFGPIFLTVVGR
jgi:hypothetical protein